MLITLAVVALGIGSLTAVLSYLVAAWSDGRPRAAQTVPFSGLVLGLVLTLLIFGLTLPATPPFSPGLRLGFGVLIGGLLGLVAAAGAGHLAREDADAWSPASGFTAGVAVAAVGLTLLLFGGDPADALLGCALGFGMIAGIVRATAAAPQAALPMEAAAVLTAILSAGGVLALYHFTAATARGWWALPLLLAAAWLLGYALVFVLSLRRRWGGRWTPAAAGLSGAVLVVVVGPLLVGRLDGREEPFLPVLLAGLLVGALVVWLSVSVAAEDAPSPARVKAGALSVLLLLFLLALTFKLLQAYGTAVALVAAAGVIGASAVAGRRFGATPVLVLTMGGTYLLLRVFLERSGVAASEVAPDLHYALVGLLLGALLPFLYASFRARPGAGQAVLQGLLGLGSGPVLAALWGPDAAVGLLGGLVIAPALAAVVQVPPGEVGLLSLGMALVAAQLAPAFPELYGLPRADKVYLAAGLAFIIILWIAVWGITRLRAERLAERPQEG